MLRWALVFLVILHLTLIIGNALSFFILPFTVPWYVAMPLCTFIVWVTFTHMECPATTVENWLRSKLGMKKIGGFIGHYIVRPVRRALYILRLWGYL